MSPANRSGIGQLPAESTSFVGRRRVLTEVKAAFANSRLLSLVGPAHWRRFHYFAVPCVETQGCIQSSTHESVLDLGWRGGGRSDSSLTAVRANLGERRRTDERADRVDLF